MIFAILNFIIVISILLLNAYLTIKLSFLFFGSKSSVNVQDIYILSILYLLAVFLSGIITEKIDKSLRLISLLKLHIYFILISLVFIVLSLTSSLRDMINTDHVILFSVLNSINPFYIIFTDRMFKKLKLLKIKALIISDPENIDMVKKWIEREAVVNYIIVNILKVNSHRDIYLLEKSGEFQSAPKDVDLVLFSNKNSDPEKLFPILNTLHRYFRKIIYIPPDPYPLLANAKTIYTVYRNNFAFLLENRLLDKKNLVIKRIFDIVFSITMLIIFLPIMLLIYLVILITERQNPIFSQIRVGQNGHFFKIYKFRTMKKDAEKILRKLLEDNEDLKKEWESSRKLKNDPRITKIGKFLRKTSLDELPQIFNILIGDMSIVGPRPVVEDEIKMYGKFSEYYYSVKPGITGLWQISGRSNLSYDDRIKLDIWYIKNWTIFLDIFIIFKTIFVFFKTKDSY